MANWRGQPKNPGAGIAHAAFTSRLNRSGDSLNCLMKDFNFFGEVLCTRGWRFEGPIGHFVTDGPVDLVAQSGKDGKGTLSDGLSHAEAIIGHQVEFAPAAAHK